MIKSHCKVEQVVTINFSKNLMKESLQGSSSIIITEYAQVITRCQIQYEESFPGFSYSAIYFAIVQASKITAVIKQGTYFLYYTRKQYDNQLFVNTECMQFTTVRLTKDNTKLYNMKFLLTIQQLYVIGNQKIVWQVLLVAANVNR